MGVSGGELEPLLGRLVFSMSSSMSSGSNGPEAYDGAGGCCCCASGKYETDCCCCCGWGVCCEGVVVVEEGAEVEAEDWEVG